MGRPSSFTQEIADKICERIAGGESLHRICADDDMPATRTVLRWLADDGNSDFVAKYVRAREAQADLHAAEIVEIADNPERGEKRVTKANGDVEVTEGDMVEHRKLRILARQWYAAKLNPKKYGDKLGVEHSGSIELASALEAARKRVKGDE